MSSLPCAALTGGSGFASDPRFSAAPARPRDQSADPVADAWAEG
jgi:hypothetical protein